MSAPRWATGLLTWLAPDELVDAVVGDLEETHRRRLGNHSRFVAAALTGLETLDMAWALLRRRGMPSISLLDVKLSLRMLRKHPGLSVVSVTGMTVAVTFGGVAWGGIRGATKSTLPLDEGDRVVNVQNAMQRGLWQMPQTHLHSLETWRTEVPAFAQVGAYRIVLRNLIGADGGVSPSRVAEMTASGFRIARVPPLLGRYFSDEDELPGAPDVVVIGHGVWRDRFGGAPDVVGRPIQIGSTRHTIIGVMPEGFAFPYNERVWTPLRLQPTHYPLGLAPEMNVFARLTSDATIEGANVQLEALGERMEVLRSMERRPTPTAFPYTQEMFWGVGARLLDLTQIFVGLILVIIAINVSVLVYARTVSRAEEIAVRTALGAARSRIVSQLFTEAFLLSALAAVIGLFVAGAVLERIELGARAGGEYPYWWDFTLTPSALLYGFGVATLAATIIGVVPALGATGRRVQLRLQRSGGGASRPTLGKTWTSLIALQIAGAVAVLPIALSGLVRFANLEPPETALPLGEVMVAEVELDVDAGGRSAEEMEEAREELYTDKIDELVRRLGDWPEVAQVAVMGVPPWRDPDVRFEIDGRSVSGLTGAMMESASTGHRVGRSVVAPEIFEVVDVPVLDGRLPTRRDAVEGATSIVVNEVFVDLVLKGGPAIGTRLRFPRRVNPELGDRSDMDGVGQPWYTIVGVVPSFPPGSGISNPEAKAYLPLTPDHSGNVHIAVRARSGDAAALSGQVRRFVAAVDPMLRLSSLETMDTMVERANAGFSTLVAAVGVLAGSVLLLAIAGLYALMSFTVARRRREIGIRIALGARHGSVLTSILLSATWQQGIGLALGLLASGALNRFVGGELLGLHEAVLLPAVALLMAFFGVLAAWAPTQAALRIQPTEALRSE